MIKVVIKLALALIVGIILFYAVLFLIIYSLDPCKNEIIQTAYSPDKKYKVILFQRDCGATTGFSSQISLLNSKERLKDSGNLYIAEGYPKNIKIEWIDNKHIKITHPKQKVFKKKKELINIFINYKSRLKD